jgi:hypothetical protein
MLLQKAVIIDPYARSIVGRRQYGQLAQVRYLFFHRIAVLLPGGTKQFLGNTYWQSCTPLPYALHGIFHHMTTAN